MVNFDLPTPLLWFVIVGSQGFSFFKSEKYEQWPNFNGKSRAQFSSWHCQKTENVDTISLEHIYFSDLIATP